MTLDPFAVLGLSPSFELDLAEAERRHRELSKALHPDRHSGSSPTERRQALGKAIEVNEAWRTLRDPVRRAEALLERLGLAVGEAEEPKPDPELLMEMMELREELGEAGRAKDLAALERLSTRVKARETATLARLGEKFRAVQGGAAVNGSQEALLRALGELRYCRRFLDEAGVLLDEIA